MKKVYVFLLLILYYITAVSQLAQSIDFKAIADKSCYDSPFLLTATASSGLAVKYSVSLGKVNLAGNLLAITGTGSVLIKAEQDGDAIFAAAPSITQTFFVKIPYDQSSFPTSFSPKGNWCEKETIVESIQTATGLSFRWRNQNGLDVVSPKMEIMNATSSNSGLYKLTMFEGNCLFTDIDFRINVHPLPEPKIFNAPDSIFSNQPSFSIVATPTGGIFSGRNVSSNQYVPSQSVFGLDTISYVFADKFGCSSTDRKVVMAFKYLEPIKEPKDTSLVIYELITPNNDGKNDFWQIDHIEKYSDYELNIFDRWGRLVFQTKSYQNDWNGNGLPEGSYFYQLKMKSPVKNLNGSIFLTR